MKTRAMFMLIAVLTGSLIVSPAFAQRGGGRAGGGGVGGGRGFAGPMGGRGIGGPVGGRAIATNPMNSPSTPIAPMMSAPVQPFVNYNHPSPSAIIPMQGRNMAQPLSRGGFDRRGDGVVVVDGGYIASPYSYGYGFDPFYGTGFDPFAWAPLLMPAPVPGQLPYTYPVAPYVLPTVPGQLPNTYPLFPQGQPTVPLVDPPPPPQRIVSSEPVYEPEPEVIVPVDSAAPKKVPDLLTSREDVEATWGQPFGVVVVHGRQTAYYRNGLVVVYEGGRAAQVQKR